MNEFFHIILLFTSSAAPDGQAPAGHWLKDLVSALDKPEVSQPPQDGDAPS